jgi:LPS sulfotransferase NodH
VRRAARASVVRLAAHVSALRGRLEAAGIERTFFICSTPRTGSTMLGNLLADTGLVGRAGEYFGEFFRRDVVHVLDCTRHARGTGTLGIKLHWDQVEVFVYLLRLRRGLGGSNDREVIQAVFPAPSYVWMTRDDTLAQAVSWWKAITTGKWTDGRPVTGEAAFDVDGIAGRIRRIEEHTEAWRRWFETNGIEPLRVTYERLAADPTAVARSVLDSLGVAVPADFAVIPGTEQQADAVNEDWIRRYREQAQ